MRSGKSQRHFISEMAVRSALDALVYSSTDKRNPLLSLMLVDNFLLDPDLPLSSRSREFALSHILTSIVTSEFIQRLDVYKQTIPPVTNSRETVLAFISGVSEFHSSDLIGWTWLYYRYVAVNHNITTGEFAYLSHIDDRTLRRYQQQAVRQLTDRLMKEEWAICIQQRRRKLYTELPSMGVLSIEGRHSEYEYMLRFFREASPAHLLIVGAAGIGKSALAELLVRNLVQEDLVHTVVWISQPASSRYVEQYLIERLLPEEAKFTLREYMMIYPVVIILDGFEPDEDSGHLISLLQSLITARIIITSQHSLGLPHMAVMNLTELHEKDAKKLILQAIKNANANADNHELSRTTQNIWEVAGGNPLAIHLIAARILLFDNTPLIPDNLSTLFDEAYEHLDQDARDAWIALTLLPPQRYTFDRLIQLWPAHFSFESLSKLGQIHIVEILPIDAAGCRLTNSARHYVEMRYKADPSLRQLINRFLKSVNSAHHLLIVESVLSNDWVEMDLELRVEWVRNWHHYGIQHRHWSIWRLLLESYIQESDPDLLVGYAICLRGLGEWTLACRTFEKAVAEFGRVGRFPEQANALIELSVILRYQGEYTSANALLVRAGQIASRYRLDGLIGAISLERTQIWIDLRDQKLASDMLSHLPENTLRGRMLASEIHLLIGNLQQSRAIAYNLLGKLEDNPLDEARVYTLLGRSYELEGDFNHAYEHFSVAYSKLEDREDIFALLRAQTNLGTILMKIENYAAAETLLLEAENTQALLNDRVGLAVTQHNLRLLNIALNS
jgi:tetratricopeptide (TPR) repeat protein